MQKHTKTAPHPTVAERLFNHALRMAGPCRSSKAHRTRRQALNPGRNSVLPAAEAPLCAGSSKGLPCAIAPPGASAYHLFPVRSVQFRDRLAETFHTEHEVFPSHRALLHALQLFKTKARRREVPPASLALRTCFRGHAQLVDAYTWAIAACPALGISQDALRAILCPDPLAREIAAFAAQKQAWEGSATELLEHLHESKVPRHLPLSTLGLSTEFHKETGGARAIRVAVTIQSTATPTQVAGIT